MKNKKKVIGNTVFFFALFGLTAYAVLKGKELSELAEVLKSVKPAYYIAGLVMIVVFVCCESYIIYRMLRLLHYNDVPKRNCVKYSFVGFFFRISQSLKYGKRNRHKRIFKENIFYR